MFNNLDPKMVYHAFDRYEQVRKETEMKVYKRMGHYANMTAKDFNSLEEFLQEVFRRNVITIPSENRYVSEGIFQEDSYTILDIKKHNVIDVYIVQMLMDPESCSLEIQCGTGSVSEEQEEEFHEYVREISKDLQIAQNKFT